MIFTSNYKNFKNSLHRVYSISGDRGVSADYNGSYCSLLAPKKEFWKSWHDNIGKVSEIENNKYYISNFYNEVLSHLDPEKVYEDLNSSILLCYEDNTDFCHRHIVSAWLELFLGIEVPEIDKHFNSLERPSYIKDILESVIKENMNMHGYNSIRAAYLFDKGDKLDIEAYFLEGSKGMVVSDFRQAAANYRLQADDVEDAYNKKCSNKIKSKIDDFGK